MRTPALIITLFCMGCLASCGTVAGKSDVPVVDGTCVISHNMAATDHGLNIQMGGKTFHVTLPLITWDHKGSLPLPPNWGLLELQESANGIAINLDGVKLADVAR